MKAPSSPLGQFSLLFITELVSFFIIVANNRAYNHDNYLWAAITDLFFNAQQFIMLKLIIDDPKARTWWAGAGMTLGGMCGTLSAMWVSKHLGF